MPTSDTPTIIALISAACGGIAVKVLDLVSGVPKARSDLALAERKADAEMRAELRAEAERHRTALKQALEDIRTIEEDRDQWREKFFVVNPTVMDLHRQVENLRDQLKKYQR